MNTLSFPQSVIFDFDGVLVESLEIKSQAFAELFQDYPEHVGEIVRHHESHLGVSRYKKFEHIYAQILQAPLDGETMRLLDKKFSFLVKEKVESCPLVHGALSLLDYLYGISKLFVVSGTPETELRSIVAQRGLDRYFTGIYGAPGDKISNVGMALSRHGLSAQETVMIGDSLSDLEAARAHGLVFIQRLTEGSRPFRLGEATCVNDLEELRNLWAESSSKAGFSAGTKK